MKITSLRGLAILALATLAACDGDVTVEDAPAGGGGAAVLGGSAPSDGGAGGAGASGGQGGAAAEVLVEFDTEIGQVVDGLAVRDNTAYLSFAGTGEIFSLDLTTKTGAAFGEIGWFYGLVFRGLALDAADNIYGGVFTCGSPAIFRWDDTGGNQQEAWGQLTLDPYRNGMNDLASAPNGKLFVSSSPGFIDTLDELGLPSQWLSDPALVGDALSCPNAPTDGDVGVNGIAVDASYVYVTNTNLATIVRVPIQADGSAGAPELLAGPDCELLGGADGIALDGDTLYVTVRASNSVLALDTISGDITTVYSGEPLKSPNAFGVAGDGSLIVANSSYELVQLPNKGGLCAQVQVVGKSSRLVRLSFGP